MNFHSFHQVFNMLIHGTKDEKLMKTMSIHARSAVADMKRGTILYFSHMLNAAAISSFVSMFSLTLNPKPFGVPSSAAAHPRKETTDPIREPKHPVRRHSPSCTPLASSCSPGPNI